jgi:hypothetical protein
MRPDILHEQKGGLSRAASRSARALALLAAVTGCSYYGGDQSRYCLEANPNNVLGCCGPDTHLEQGTCCKNGEHLVADVDHPDWQICIYDEDAGADARVLAHPDGGADVGDDAP